MAHSGIAFCSQQTAPASSLSAPALHQPSSQHTIAAPRSSAGALRQHVPRRTHLSCRSEEFTANASASLAHPTSPMWLYSRLHSIRSGARAVITEISNAAQRARADTVLHWQPFAAPAHPLPHVVLSLSLYTTQAAHTTDASTALNARKQASKHSWGPAPSCMRTHTKCPVIPTSSRMHALTKARVERSLPPMPLPAGHNLDRQ